MKWLPFLLLLAACSGQAPSPLLADPRPPGEKSLPSAPAAGGTDFGGGGDLEEGPKAEHWFSEKPSVSYCIEVASDFGVDETEVRSLVAESLATWEKYIEDKKLPRTVLSIRAVPTDCETTTDLVFLFGISKPELAEARAHYRNPVAFAHKSGSQGFVWFASKDIAWKDATRLKPLVLHEIGHIYGNAHVPGTIMQSDIALHLNELPVAGLSQIDFERELAVCRTCDTHFDVRFHPQPGTDPWMAAIRLLNRKPEGEVRIRFSRISLSLLNLWYPFPSLLVIEDEKGGRLWTGSPIEETIFHENQIPVFTWRSGGSTGSASSGMISTRSEYTSEGDSVRLALEFSNPEVDLASSLTGPVRLRWIDRGFPASLTP